MLVRGHSQGQSKFVKPRRISSAFTYFIGKEGAPMALSPRESACRFCIHKQIGEYSGGSSRFSLWFLFGWNWSGLSTVPPNLQYGHLRLEDSGRSLWRDANAITQTRMDICGSGTRGGMVRFAGVRFVSGLLRRERILPSSSVAPFLGAPRWELGVGMEGG